MAAAISPRAFNHRMAVEELKAALKALDLHEVRRERLRLKRMAESGDQREAERRQIGILKANRPGKAEDIAYAKETKRRALLRVPTF
jgi:hypothetical protein